MSVGEDGGADKVAELATVGLVDAVDVERMGVVEHGTGRAVGVVVRRATVLGSGLSKAGLQERPRSHQQ
jgi:hypothetical protein